MLAKEKQITDEPLIFQPELYKNRNKKKSAFMTASKNRHFKTDWALHNIVEKSYIKKALKRETGIKSERLFPFIRSIHHRST